MAPDERAIDDGCVVAPPRCICIVSSRRLALVAARFVRFYRRMRRLEVEAVGARRCDGIVEQRLGRDRGGEPPRRLREFSRSVLVLCIVAFSACEPAHPATAVAEQFVNAIRYGDKASLFAAHIDSTQQSEWCRQEFRNLLAKAQAEVRSEDCQRFRSLSAADLEGMQDEVRLAVQVSGWSCKNPKGSCVDYSEIVFQQAVEAHPLVQYAPREVSIQRLFGDETAATAHVDVVNAAGDPERLTLEFKHVGEGWRVAKGFLTK